jgi:dUTPase
MVVGRVEHVEWQPVSQLVETVRSDGGFGHTGKE